MSAAREQIIGALRRGLAVPTTIPPDPKMPQGSWFPPLPESELITAFASRVEALNGNCYIEPDKARALQRFKSLIAPLDPRKVWLQPDLPFVQDESALSHRATVASFSSQEEARTKLADAQASATTAVSLVARHGSILLAAPTQHGRLLAFLPEHHIVIARTSQVVPDLTDAYTRVRESFGAKWPSFVTTITGPSRTADIEKILVLGAHGPRELSVIIY